MARKAEFTIRVTITVSRKTPVHALHVLGERWRQRVLARIPASRVVFSTLHVRTWYDAS